MTEKSDVLQIALDAGQLALRFVPRTDADGRIVAACSALCRHGDDTPLPVGEASATVRAELDEWAVHGAVRHLAGAASVGMSLPLAVEVSGHWLHRQGTVAVLRGFLECYGGSPELLELRASHDAWFGPEAQGIAAAIRSLGCKVVVSSGDLGAMRHLPQQLDGWSVPAHPLDAFHVWAEVRDLAQSLALSVVLTDIDTVRQRDALSGLGFSAFEGPCFGDALDGRAFLQRIRRSR